MPKTCPAYILEIRTAEQAKISNRVVWAFLYLANLSFSVQLGIGGMEVTKEG